MLKTLPLAPWTINNEDVSTVTQGLIENLGFFDVDSRQAINTVCGAPCYCAAWALAVTSTPSALITANVVLSVGLPRSLNDR